MSDELRREIFKILQDDFDNIYWLKLYYFAGKAADRVRELGYQRIEDDDRSKQIEKQTQE